MGKSRVEKNKELYEELNSNVSGHHELDLEAFDLEDLGDISTEPIKEEFVLEDLADIEEPVVETIEINQEEPILEVKKEKKVEVPALTNTEEYVVEQPVSYNKMLIAEEVLREKLEKQKELKDSKRGLKRSPITESYSAEAMQKNIKQHVGVDVRKELNIKIKRSNGRVITILVILLIAIVAAGIALAYMVLKS